MNKIRRKVVNTEYEALKLNTDNKIISYFLTEISNTNIFVRSSIEEKITQEVHLTLCIFMRLITFAKI